MDATLYWNAILLEASRRDFTRGYNNSQQPGPIRTSYAMAIVHIAIHDAFCFSQSLPNAAYMTKKGFAHGLTATTADLGSVIAGAAVTTLKALYPKYTRFFDDSLGPVNAAAFAFGVSIGTAVLTMRWGPALNPEMAVDKSNDAITRPQPSMLNRGDHRADPYQPGQPQLGPKWGEVATFLADRFAPTPKNRPLGPFPGAGEAGHNYIANPDYKLQFDEVRDLGSATRGARTAEQQRIGVYWGYDGANNLGVPPRLYNQIARLMVQEREAAGTPLTKGQVAELFAIVNVAMAEAGIDAWHHKYVYNLWRPVVGIRNEDTSVGGDPFWAPLGAPTTNVPGRSTLTPPFPAYPSGHATFGAAVFQVLRLSLKTAPGPIGVADVLAFNGPSGAAIAKEGFMFVSDELDGVAADPDGSTRTKVEKHFKSFAEAVWENAVSRVYLGVHWRFDGLPLNAGDNIGGVPLGLTIGAEAHGFFNTGPSISGTA